MNRKTLANYLAGAVAGLGLAAGSVVFAQNTLHSDDHHNGNVTTPATQNTMHGQAQTGTYGMHGQATQTQTGSNNMHNQASQTQTGMNGMHGQTAPVQNVHDNMHESNNTQTHHAPQNSNTHCNFGANSSDKQS